MIFDYSISGLRIRCDLPFTLTVTRESAPFLMSFADDRFDLLFSVAMVDSIDNHVQWNANQDIQCFADGHSWDVYHRAPLSGVIYAHIHWNDQLPDAVNCTIRKDCVHLLTSTQNLLNLLSVETILLNSQCLLLHSAFISHNGAAILFSAPSGTGKSTQAALWEQYRNADIINGDRAALRCMNGKWTAWGLPYAGTSGIFRNESASVHAVVVLRQSKENVIRRLRAGDALRYLYPELTLHRWEATSVESAMDLLTNLVTSVPVFLLECRPDEDAVCVLEQALKEVVK